MLEQDLTPFQRYKLRCMLKIQQLKLAGLNFKDNTGNSPISVDFELLTLEEIVKDLDENMIPMEKIFAEQCYKQGFNAGKSNEYDNCFLNNLYNKKTF